MTLIGQDHGGKSNAQVALNWAIRKGTLVIPGAKNAAQAMENAGALGWKLTDEDWRNRDKWEPYAQAVGEMIQRTSTPQAPWTIVEAECKLYARLKSLRTVAEAMQAAVERAGQGRKRRK